MLQKSEQTSLTSFWLGRKCVFCGHRKLWKTRRGYVKCRYCKRQKGLKKLRRELSVIVGFHQQQTARQCALDLNLSYHTIERVYHRLRELLWHICELEGAKLSGEIEIDETYFGGRRKGNRGRGTAGNLLFWGFWGVNIFFMPRLYHRFLSNIPV